MANKWVVAIDRWFIAPRHVSKATPQRSNMELMMMTSCGKIGRMATSRRIEAALAPPTDIGRRLTGQLDMKCPCCGSRLTGYPAGWNIEPCFSCRRPLAMIRTLSARRTYRLCNVLDLVGSAYGVVTMLLVASFVLSEMDAKIFAKAVTILLFVIGSLLPVDGSLSMKTAIDRTWKITRRGIAARLLGMCKTLAGTLAIGLVFVGLSL